MFVANQTAAVSAIIASLDLSLCSKLPVLTDGQPYDECYGHPCVAYMLHAVYLQRQVDFYRDPFKPIVFLVESLKDNIDIH